VGGDNIGYMLIISCRRAAIVPYECHKTGARSGNDSRFLLNSRSAVSLCMKKYMRKMMRVCFITE
jgi:hypothetical protein